MINYVYDILTATAKTTQIIGATSYNFIKLIPTNIASMYYKNDRAIENVETVDTKDIQTVIHDYKKIRTRYQVNKRIIETDKKYQENIQDTIDNLQDLNKNLNDEYINEWIETLNHRKTIINNDVDILIQSQKAFKQFSLKEETQDIDTLTICNVCMENKKDKSLDCGHIFCNACLYKMNSCPTCRIDIEKTKIRNVFI